MKDGPKVKDFCLQIPDVISLHILAFAGESSVVSIEDLLRQFCEKSWVKKIFHLRLTFPDFHVHTGICGKFFGNLGNGSGQFLFEDVIQV